MGLLTTLLDGLWAAITYVAPFLFVLLVVVFVHEFGHFIVGRLCGANAKVFSLGIGPEIIGLTDRVGTRWRISAIPLGGYVRFASPPKEGVAAMPPDQRKTTLEGQRLPQRAAIVVAGPVANFLFAILVFASTAYFLGDTKLAPRIASVDANSAAERAGLKHGDLVRTINGAPVETFPDLFEVVGGMADQSMAIGVERDGKMITLSATPALAWSDTPFGRQRRGVLGVHSSTDPADFTIVYPGPLQALEIGLTRTGDVVAKTGRFIGGIFAGHGRSEQLSGPIGIAQMSNALAPLGFGALITLAGLLSVSLGLMNLAPIPIFDGGHLMFYAIEAARGQPLSRGLQEIGLRVGLACLFALTIFVTFNDIRRMFAS